MRADEGLTAAMGLGDADDARGAVGSSRVVARGILSAATGHAPRAVRSWWTGATTFL